MIPKIEFRSSFVYDNNFRDLKWIKEYLRKQKKKYPLDKEIENYIKKIKPIWKKYEKDILSRIQKITGLKWRDKKILVYVVGICRPISDPLTIGIYKDKKVFIDTLAHELIHQIQFQNEKNIGNWWKYVFNKYKKEPFKTKGHIFLYAVHWKLLLEIFNEKRLKENIKFDGPYSDYKRAWEIVEKEGYENIIKKFKESQK